MNRKIILMSVLAIIMILTVLTGTVFADDATPQIAQSPALTEDKLIPISYPKAGGYVWVPKEAEAGRAYPMLLIFSGGSGKNYYVGPSTYHLETKVRRWINQGKMHPVILIAPTTLEGSAGSPINNFNINEFNLREAIAKVNSEIQEYGISVDEQRVTVAGHSNGGIWRNEKPGYSGVYGVVATANDLPLYAAALLDGSFNTKSAEFLHEKLDSTSTKVFSLIGKNRPPGQLPMGFITPFVGETAIPCSDPSVNIEYNTKFFRDCRKAADRDWYNYVTFVGGPSQCPQEKGTPEYDACKKDNKYSHGNIPWKFFEDWLPRLYPKDLPPVDATVANIAAQTQASGVTKPDGFRFIMLGDTHQTRDPTETQKRLIEKVISLKPSFVISGGDMISGNPDTDLATIQAQWDLFDKFIGPVIQAGIPFFPSAGNHDAEMGNSVLREEYKRKWASHTVPGISITDGKLNSYHSFDYQNSHFAILYDAKAKLDKEQVDWLEKDIQSASEKENIFVVGHVALKNARQNTGHTGGIATDRVISILKDGKVDVFFAAHNHVYTEMDVDGVRQISCGHSQPKKANGIPVGGTEVQREPNFIVVDVVGDTFNYYVVEGPDFTKSVDGREIPEEPSKFQATENIPIVTTTAPKTTGFIGLYDFFFRSIDGDLLLRAIGRYPLGLGVRSSDLESVVSITPPIGGAGGVTLSAGAGVSPGESQTCHYCGDSKKFISQLYPDKYSACLATSGKCCEAPCPPGSVIKDGVPLILQCSKSAMGPGGDCWRDGSPPDSKAGSGYGGSYCSAACGVASMRMALRGYGIDMTSEELFCEGDNSVYIPGGSVMYKMRSVLKKQGRTDAQVSRTFDWGTMTDNIAKGNVVILLLGDKIQVEKGTLSTERCFTTNGHYIVLLGASANFVIAHDPGGHCRNGGEKNMVLSRDYIEGAFKGYVIT